ncbi:Antizyme inhibitor 1 [Fukomys damarensis]|uniref:Antizyme inhibitor 1 n=1 Tax=Fukomys damarensis TaxID=885580 RepID=A0A091DB42_FUKDA|nr:Antizyme inhibitor 1 [Fukomys damarensis]
MKGFIDDANYSVGLLDEGTDLGNVIDNYVNEHTLTGKSAFFVGDLGKIVKRHSQWQSVVAQIRPFYVVKCNPAPAVLETLAALGTGFACSSKNEMALVQDLGVSPENIIYISPCKQVSQIKYAAKTGVNIMTCDNEIELKKIARNHLNAKVLLHLATEDGSGGEEGSMKLGSTLKNCRHLLECAKELDVQIIGVKFHVSSACKESQVYVHALSDARCVFDMAGEFGFTMSMLDIGGGFTGTAFQLEEKYKEDEPLFASSLWGPSCDELDRVVERCLLPELHVGDWLIFANMGADSLQEASAFRDVPGPAVYYTMSFSDWYEMQDAGVPLDTMMKNFFFVPSCLQLSQDDSFPTEA